VTSSVSSYWRTSVLTSRMSQQRSRWRVRLMFACAMSWETGAGESVGRCAYPLTGGDRTLCGGGDAMQGLGGLEEAVMGVLWESQGPLTVRDVLSEINRSRTWPTPLS
jgi:hypothetical protein